jgi:uncharacterized membrane protein YfcA
MVSTELIILCLASFGAGFIDSMVGGGGLIQFPAFLMVLPEVPVVSLLATNKLVSMTGTAVSTYRFSRHIPYIKAIILPALASAFIFSFLGAYTVSIIDNNLLKPLFIILLFTVFISTIRNKQFGIIDHSLKTSVPLWRPMVIGSVLGFYDGFFGPGTGSFLIIAFVGLLGMTYVQGSAYAKVVNLTTNLAAILLFSLKTEFHFQYALPMMLFNVGGALMGVKVAILKGNEFVRGVLRVIVLLIIVKLAYELLK